VYARDKEIGTGIGLSHTRAITDRHHLMSPRPCLRRQLKAAVSLQRLNSVRGNLKYAIETQLLLGVTVAAKEKDEIPPNKTKCCFS